MLNLLGTEFVFPIEWSKLLKTIGVAVIFIAPTLN